MKARSKLLFGRISAATFILYTFVLWTPASPDAPVISNGVAYFEGNQSNGVFWTASASVPSIVVSNLTSDITPSSGITGINLTDNNTAINSSVTYQRGTRRILTSGDTAAGILAASGGENGGDGDPGYYSFPTSYYDGEDGDDGQSSGTVDIFSTGEIETSGADSSGIYARSQAGSGGDGGNGYDGNANDTNGGDGGAGGNAGAISISGSVSVATSGKSSHGIHAQSKAGSGGSGGTSYDNSGYGGKGAAGGQGGTIGISGDGTIETSGLSALGIFAESVGGAGGKGGDGRSHAAGEYGGDGGSGGNVSVAGSWTITTHSNNAAGIQLLSRAGDGGNGGKGHPAGGTGEHGNLGGTGGDAGHVTVTSHVDIVTYGDSSTGIIAQSHAGGGGDGGDGYRRFAGSGRAGGQGGDILIGEGGRIVTHGIASAGILAESLGGDGGDGGEGFRSADGGNGGTGGDAGNVTVNGIWDITTTNDGSSCIISRSIGGTGGDGDISGWNSDISGHGKTGGDGGMITVDADLKLATTGNNSIGIFSWSQGRDGGDGGEGIEGTANDGIGGDGGAGGNGGTISIERNMLVVTSGDRSHGIQAQSRGGIGGSGGATYENGDYGGKGAVGGAGGMIELSAGGTIDTGGFNAIGIYLESLGGTGGKGGDGDSHADGQIGGAGGGGGAVSVNGNWQVTTRGDDASGMQILSNAGDGGDGGNGYKALGDDSDGNRGGDGGNGGMISTTGNVDIVTYGDNSSGINAQSHAGSGGNGGLGHDFYGGAGGNGGQGGDVLVGQGGTIATHGTNAAGVFAASTGGAGGEGGEGFDSAVGRDGGTGGHAGSVLVNGTWNISTTNEDSSCIVSRSVGGEGGDGGESGSLSDAGGDGNTGGNAGAVKVEGDGILSTIGPNASGILALSQAGDGGDGGEGHGIANGGHGGSGGTGGDVDIAGSWDISIQSNSSHGISARSLGGVGGSGNSGGIASGFWSGNGGDGGDGGDGGKILINLAPKANGRAGMIETIGNDSYGIFASSIGHAGGNGGDCYAINALANAKPGSGGDGGYGGTISITGACSLVTHGSGSSAIVAKNEGGDGGDLGDTYGVGNSMIDDFPPGNGGNGAEILIDGEWSLETYGTVSYGIFASGEGGNGGDAGVFYGMDLDLPVFDRSPGGTGGNGGGVTVSGKGSVVTHGIDSTGIMAQSEGGKGGKGMIMYGLGGGSDGGAGGAGSGVSIFGNWYVQTENTSSHGIMLQSKGGAGGEGGELYGGDYKGLASSGAGGEGGNGGTVSGQGEWTVETQGDGSQGFYVLSEGGAGGGGGPMYGAGITILDQADGGGGGASGSVMCTGLWKIVTQGDNSGGIYAKSAGGKGGDGGEIDAITIGGHSDGGYGGNGSNVYITGSGIVTNAGKNSAGIYAQSIGGDGGSSGSPIDGLGGSGGRGGLVTITGEWSIVTLSSGSTGIVALSEGGKGGSGALEGDGGTGGRGRRVTLAGKGTVENYGSNSIGIIVQSIGGDGGAKGRGTSIPFTGDGGNGGAAVADGNWNIITQGDYSCGVIAESRGGKGNVGETTILVAAGGGGLGGLGNMASLTGSWNITTYGAGSHGIELRSIGGKGGDGGESKSSGDAGRGGDGGSGSRSSIDGTGTILTYGNNATGISALSRGGQGGDGGKGGHSINIDASGKGGDGGDSRFVAVNGDWNITTFGLSSIGIQAMSTGANGGTGGDAYSTGQADNGGDGGNANNVSVTGDGTIETSGDRAHGIYARSTGGSGGDGGKYDGADTSGDSGAGDGGNGGDGGDVTIEGGWRIITHGSLSAGILAESFRGTGGRSGFNYGGNSGSDGSGGKANNVTVSGMLDITTYGTNSNGIIVRSAGKESGDIDISLSGNVKSLGVNSTAIYAESNGPESQGNITVTIDGGTVIGGTGSGVGVRFVGGAINTLTNFGTISTMNGAAGTAILGTPNNEYIFNEGVIIESVDLGGGSNVFNNAASAAFHSGAIVNLGAGNRLVNEGTLSPGGLTTLLTGDLLMTTSSLFRIDISAASGSDQLVVDGTATLDGSIDIINGGGVFTNGMVFEVLVSSNNLVHGFSSTNLPTTKPLLRFDLEQETDRIKVKTTAHSFESVAQNRLEKSVGRHLDTLIPTVSGDLLDIMSAFQNADAGEFSDAFRSLGPSSHDATTRAAVSAARQAPGNLQRRMTALPSRGESVSQPAGAAGPGSPLIGVERLTPDNPYGLWISGVGLQGEQDGADGFSGYGYRTSGMELGIERLFQKKVMAGISIDYASTDVDIDQNGGNSDIESIGGSLYAARYSEGWYFDGILRYANQEFDNRRNISVGSTNRTASSSHSGDLISGSTSVRYDISKSKWKVGPLASIQYMYLAEDGFSETGGGGANLTVSDRNTDSLISELGVRITRTFETERGAFVPAVQLGWLYDFNIGDNTITAAYEGAPNTPFTINGQDVDENGLLLGIDLRFLGTGRFAFGLEYDADIRSSYSAHRILGNLHYAF